MKRIIPLLLCLFLFVFVSTSAAQQIVPNLYQQVVSLFKDKAYSSALTLLDSNDHASLAEHAQEVQYMRATISYELNQPDAIQRLTAYLSDYPDTPYRNTINARIGSAYFFQKKYEASSSFLQRCELDELPTAECSDCTYRLAYGLMQRQQYVAATIWWKTLRATSLRYVDQANYQLAFIAYQQQHYAEALTAFLPLQHIPAYQAIVPYYIAAIYYAQKNYSQVVSVATPYLKSFATDTHAVEMQRLLGGAYFFLEQYNEAIPLLSAFATKGKQQIREVYYQLGLSYYRTEQYPSAIQSFQKVCGQQDAMAQNAYLHSGFSFLRLEQQDKARIVFEQAALMNNDPAVTEQAAYNYALSLHATSYSAFGESVTAFENFINRYPQSKYVTTVSDYLVEVYMTTKSYATSLASINKIAYPNAKILTAKQHILYELGVEAFANAAYAKAINYFDQSLQVGPYSTSIRANAYYWKGESSYRLNDKVQAARYFTTYLSLAVHPASDMYALAQYALGYIHFGDKEYEEAADRFLLATSSTALAPNVTADVYNRLGDCAFQRKQFSDAQGYYALAQEKDTTMADYSLYQEALVVGRQHDYLGKIHFLKKLIESYPHSNYVETAYYECGRSYVQLKDNRRAIQQFLQVVERFPDRPLARKSANEIGLLYYQDNAYNKAIEAYKLVVRNYPESEEATLALKDLQSIYIDTNNIDAYAAYVNTLNTGVKVGTSQRDSLTYIAAEKIYLRGEKRQAVTSFQRYLKEFPQGKYTLNAHYYIGVFAYRERHLEGALAHFKPILAYPDNAFSESTMVYASEIYYGQREYQEAYKVYQLLKTKSTTREHRVMAKLGMFRCVYMLRQHAKVITAAAQLLAEKKLTQEEENEARYGRAKSYLQLKDIEGALPDLKILSKDPRNRYGAEAKYLLADCYFTQKRYETAEKEILNYIEQSTPHAYWLAKSFLLLSDVYVQMDRPLEAQQYLLSLQQNYKGKDEIADKITERLDQLNKQKKKN